MQYTGPNITSMFMRDFPMYNQAMLAAKPVDPIPVIVKGNRVIIQDELLDYLKNFYNGIFDGEPIPKVFEKCLIEVNYTADGKIRRFYVTFPEDKPNWVYVDVFLDWLYIGKLFYANLSLSDSMRTEDGSFLMYTPFIAAPNNLMTTEEYVLMNEMARDIFFYVYIYIHANKNNPEVYNHTKKRRIYTVKKDERATKNAANYMYSRWKVRGYSYTRADGKVIDVREHYATRHLPNKGVEKLGKERDLHVRNNQN